MFKDSVYAVWLTKRSNAEIYIHPSLPLKFKPNELSLEPIKFKNDIKHLKDVYLVGIPVWMSKILHKHKDEIPDFRKNLIKE